MKEKKSIMIKNISIKLGKEGDNTGEAAKTTRQSLLTSRVGKDSRSVSDHKSFCLSLARGKGSEQRP